MPATNIGFKGLDVVQAGNFILLRMFLQDANDQLVTAGPTNVYIDELQSDATIKSLDFSDYSFKTTVLGTSSGLALHQKRNNAAEDTGYWTVALTGAQIAQFTPGAIYLVKFRNSNASPNDQADQFQYGGAEGDVGIVNGKVQMYQQDTLIGTASDGTIGGALLAGQQVIRQFTVTDTAGQPNGFLTDIPFSAGYVIGSLLEMITGTLAGQAMIVTSYSNGIVGLTAISGVPGFATAPAQNDKGILRRITPAILRQETIT